MAPSARIVPRLRGLLLAASVLLPASLPAQVHVDGCGAPGGDGSAGRPVLTVRRGAQLAFVGDTLQVQGGSYPESLVLDRPLTLTAAGGPVLIGRHYTGQQEVCVPVPFVQGDPSLHQNCASSGLGVSARVYFPARDPAGQQHACRGPRPAVAYTHGFRFDVPTPFCPWSQPGPVQHDYRQLGGILRRLAARGILAVSVDSSPANQAMDTKAFYLVHTLAFLRDQNLPPGSLAGLVDLERLGLAGHSTGGGGAVIAANDFRGGFFEGLNLDSLQVRGVGLLAPAGCSIPPSGTPLLVVHGENEHPRQVSDHPVERYGQSTAPKHLAVIAGANHFGYTDGICLDPSTNRDNASTVGGATGAEAQARQQRAAGEYLLRFFAHYLQPGGAPPSAAPCQLTQASGQQCGDPGDAGVSCDLVAVPATQCGAPLCAVPSLTGLGIGVGLCSCQ
jgi:hypothetical protein